MALIEIIFEDGSIRDFGWTYPDSFNRSILLLDFVNRYREVKPKAVRITRMDKVISDTIIG